MFELRQLGFLSASLVNTNEITSGYLYFERWHLIKSKLENWFSYWFYGLILFYKRKIYKNIVIKTKNVYI